MGEKHGRSILLTKHLFHACKVLLHAVNLRHGPYLLSRRYGMTSTNVIPC
jgi:hypothetical protein